MISHEMTVCFNRNRDQVTMLESGMLNYQHLMI